MVITVVSLLVIGSSLMAAYKIGPTGALDYYQPKAGLLNVPQPALPSVTLRSIRDAMVAAGIMEQGQEPPVPEWDPWSMMAAMVSVGILGVIFLGQHHDRTSP